MVGWLFSAASGSSQTVAYSTLTATNDAGGDDLYAGMLDYAHFGGAANRDLGLDSMTSGIGGEILNAIGGGSMIWLSYALALAVGMAFWVVIQLFQLLNPFLWFYQGVRAVNPTFADGMVHGGDMTAVNGPLAGMAAWIGDWYQVINGLAWQTLVPLFIASLAVGLLLYRRMDRGSAIKKLIVRMVFIGVGLPLLGSMYTGGYWPSSTTRWWASTPGRPALCSRPTSISRPG